MPLIRRLPKRGFNNAAFHRRFAIVNLTELNAFEAGTTVNEQLLRESNLVRGQFAGIKILGDGELKHGLTVEADQVSAAAREKIEKAGGTITLRKSGAPKPPTAAEGGMLTEKGSVEPAAQGGKKRSRRQSGKARPQPKKRTSRAT
jgi:large subunit ribosomal protein L15